MHTITIYEKGGQRFKREYIGWSRGMKSATDWIQLVLQPLGEVRVPVLRWARSRRNDRHGHTRECCI